MAKQCLDTDTSILGGHIYTTHAHSSASVYRYSHSQEMDIRAASARVQTSFIFALRARLRKHKRSCSKGDIFYQMRLHLLSSTTLPEDIYGAVSTVWSQTVHDSFAAKQDAAELVLPRPRTA